MIDTFIFYNELDLLEYRLHLLNEYIDYFVLVESTHTFVGNKKELYYNNNKERFKKYNDKIIHIIVDDMPIKSKITENKSIWDNEFHQRNCIQRGLDKLKVSDNEIIIISDVDEIPDPSILKNIDKYKIKINNLVMDLYWYNLNRKNMNYQEKATKILYYKYLKQNTIQQIRQSVQPLLTNERSGWHLSYIGDITFINNIFINYRMWSSYRNCYLTSIFRRY